MSTLDLTAKELSFLLERITEWEQIWGDEAPDGLYDKLATMLGQQRG